MVGSIGFHTVSPEHRTAELAYDLSPAVWGQGIASAMCRLLVTWAHGHVCLLRSYRLVRGRPGDFWMYGHVAPLLP